MESSMRSRLQGFVLMFFLACAASCQGRREVQVHFQEGFDARPAEAILIYNSGQVFNGNTSPSPLTGHPCVARFRIGSETSGTLSVGIPGGLTNTFTLVWSNGFAVGLTLSNGVMNCTQSTGFGYILE